MTEMDGVKLMVLLTVVDTERREGVLEWVRVDTVGVIKDGVEVGL